MSVWVCGCWGDSTHDRSTNSELFPTHGSECVCESLERKDHAVTHTLSSRATHTRSTRGFCRPCRLLDALLGSRVARGNCPMDFKEGETVMGNFKGLGDWEEALIVGIAPDGTYTLECR